MDTRPVYGFISKGYDALDVLYFKNEGRSPRQAVSEWLGKDGLNILDICTGTAANSIKIAEKNPRAKIIGIDLSEAMLNIAKGKLEEKGIGNIELKVMDATNINFKEETFDAAVISLVLHELKPNIARKMLLEARRVLKPEGKLIVVEWEEPERGMDKLRFFPVRLVEPWGFAEFLKMDMGAYFLSSGFNIEEIKHCDYSKAIMLKKTL